MCWYSPSNVVQLCFSQHKKPLKNILKSEPTHRSFRKNNNQIQKQQSSQKKKKKYLAAPKKVVCFSFCCNSNGASFSAAMLTARKIAFQHIRWLIAYRGGSRLMLKSYLTAGITRRQLDKEGTPQIRHGYLCVHLIWSTEVDECFCKQNSKKYKKYIKLQWQIITSER